MTNKLSKPDSPEGQKPPESHRMLKISLVAVVSCVAAVISMYADVRGLIREGELDGLLSVFQSSEEEVSASEEDLSGSDTDVPSKSTRSSRIDTAESSTKSSAPSFRELPGFQSTDTTDSMVSGLPLSMDDSSAGQLSLDDTEMIDPDLIPLIRRLETDLDSTDQLPQSDSAGDLSQPPIPRGVDDINDLLPQLEREPLSR